MSSEDFIRTPADMSRCAVTGGSSNPTCDGILHVEKTAGGSSPLSSAACWRSHRGRRKVRDFSRVCRSGDEGTWTVPIVGFAKAKAWESTVEVGTKKDIVAGAPARSACLRISTCKYARHSSRIDVKSPLRLTCHHVPTIFWRQFSAFLVELECLIPHSMSVRPGRDDLSLLNPPQSGKALANPGG